MNHVTRFAYDENNNTKYRSFHCDPKKYIIAGLSIGSPGKHFPMNRSYIAAPNIGPYVRYEEQCGNQCIEYGPANKAVSYTCLLSARSVVCMAAHTCVVVRHRFFAALTTRCSA